MNLLQEAQRAYAQHSREDRRSVPRERLQLPAKLRASGSHGFSMIVTDISIAGFSCEAATGMGSGTYCWLSIAGLGGQEARVIWNDGINLGCAFSHRLSQSVVDHINK